jgi:hypothetical protein
MGHSALTHALAYASERFDDESHFKAYHSAIGDTSHRVLAFQTNTISLGDIRLCNESSVSKCYVTPWSQLPLRALSMEGYI